MTPGLGAGCRPCCRAEDHSMCAGWEQKLQRVCCLPFRAPQPEAWSYIWETTTEGGRERHTQKEREGRNGINCLWLWLIFIGLLVFDSSPFLCSFLTFHKWPSTLEHIVQEGQRVPQKLAVTSAGPIHTSTPSIALCHSIPGSALQQWQRRAQTCKKQGNKSCLGTNSFLRVLIDPLTHSPRRWRAVVTAEVMYGGE